jgi:hypothetical protein
MSKGWIILALVACASSRAEVVDGMVASVETAAIKHSDVMREITMTALMNRETPNFGVASQKEAVNRLVDQALIRTEIDAGAYVADDPHAADGLLRQIRASYGGTAAFARALASNGITEEALRKHLRWQATVLRFVQLRFGGGPTGASPEMVNEAFFAWLDQMRKERRVEIREARLK